MCLTAEIERERELSMERRMLHNDWDGSDDVVEISSRKRRRQPDQGEEDRCGEDCPCRGGGGRKAHEERREKQQKARKALVECKVAVTVTMDQPASQTQSVRVDTRHGEASRRECDCSGGGVSGAKGATAAGSQKFETKVEVSTSGGGT